MLEQVMVIDLRETQKDFNNRLKTMGADVTPWTMRKLTEHMIHVAFGEDPTVLAANTAESLLRDLDKNEAYSALVGYAGHIEEDMAAWGIAPDIAGNYYQYRLETSGTLAVWIRPKPDPITPETALFNTTRDSLLRDIEEGAFVPERTRRLYDI